MTFQDGWLRRQIAAASEEVNSWSKDKQEVMLREESNPFISSDREEQPALDRRNRELIEE